MMPVVQSQLGATDGLEIELGGVVKCVSYLKLDLDNHDNKSACDVSSRLRLNQSVNTLLSASSA